MLDSQADGLLVFITNPGTAAQTDSALLLQPGVLVDDTVFAGTADKTLLVADKTTNNVYAITGPFGFNTGYSAAADPSGTIGFVGALNQTTGNFTPIVTGLDNPGGEAFLAVPEPSSMSLLGAGLLLLIGRRRKAAAKRVAAGAAPAAS